MHTLSVLCRLSAILFALPARARADPGSLDQPGILPLVTHANALLSSGQFHDAAQAYSDAIEQFPLDPALFYKRATALFSLQRYDSALADFDHVLSLASDSFDKAHYMRARILAKDGRFADAKDALKTYAHKVPADPAGRDLLLELSDAEAAATKVDGAMKARLWTACEEAATTALITAPHAVGIRQKRAFCALAAGDYEQGLGDLTRLTHITAPSASDFMRIFRIAYFYLPASPQALSALKQCLHRDPDSKPCLSAHRTLKKLDRQTTALDALMASEDWRAILTHVLGSTPRDAAPTQPGDAFLAQLEHALTEHGAPAALALPHGVTLPAARRASPRRAAVLRALCRAYVQLGQARAGERWCDELLRMLGAEEDIDALLGKGEALLAREEWEEAVRAFERAWRASGGGNREIHKRLQKAQRLLKQSRQKDYYKVLGVARDADERTIKKAYRKAVMTAHPDKGGSEAKMASVNEAYEVLSDPQLRARFDNGDDPNDPQAGGNPFAGQPGGGGGGGGFPFGAGGFQQFFQQAGSQGGGPFQFHQQHGGGGGGGGGFRFKFGGF
ncbi:hypothetical protein K488DRAFT_92278 [Vararia minispora EC-137]|uniref:Uncharacterized protein n=1 Tax=Vararia minispora EC-137 TaxID=1314806 RepID=A0ACB8Q4J6_9AGAM|nr:hypothetical protein K488DRAFT_92278 [Vararia minispora EC-137]